MNKPLDKIIKLIQTKQGKLKNQFDNLSEENTDSFSSDSLSGSESGSIDSKTNEIKAESNNYT